MSLGASPKNEEYSCRQTGGGETMYARSDSSSKLTPNSKNQINTIVKQMLCHTNEVNFFSLLY